MRKPLHMLFPTLLFLACDDPGTSCAPVEARVLPRAAAPDPEATQRRTAEDVGRDFLAFVGREVKPDIYQRYIRAMAEELVDISRWTNPGGDPNAKISCSGTYENSQCWNVSCSCDTVSSCHTMFGWCGVVNAKQEGLTCSAAAKGGCP
jgi:hypothetical protein